MGAALSIPPFFQAVRLLQRLGGEREPVGQFVPPASEVAHFGATPTVNFRASEIQTFDWNDARPADLTVHFMGLTRPMGVLPLDYTEFVMDRVREADTALRDFPDISNHRMISSSIRPIGSRVFPLPSSFHANDAFSSAKLALLGFGTAGLRNQIPFPDDLLIYYAGLLMKRGRSATALKQIISDYFEVDVEVEEFAGSWQ